MTALARRHLRGSPWTPWLYLAPALAVIAALLVYPVGQLGLISVLEYGQPQVSGGRPTSFQGLGNYARIFGDGQFWQVLLTTVLFAAACVAGTLVTGCALAVLLTRVRGGCGWLRGFVQAVPDSLEEQAYLDGASRSRFLWQILFPLVFPGLVATGVFLVHIGLE